MIRTRTVVPASSSMSPCHALVFFGLTVALALSCGCRTEAVSVPGSTHEITNLRLVEPKQLEAPLFAPVRFDKPVRSVPAHSITPGARKSGQAIISVERLPSAVSSTPSLGRFADSRPDAASSPTSNRNEVGHLLKELAFFVGKKDAELALAEKLRKQAIQKKLIALYELGEERVVEPLLESLEEFPESPGKTHTLFVAAFYHKIDREELCDRTLSRLTLGRGQRGSFRIANVTVCTDVRGYRDYDPIRSKTLRSGESRYFYGELHNLTNRPTEGGYRTGINALLRILDEDGDEVRRIHLSAVGGDQRVQSERMASEACFYYLVKVPRDLDGRYRFVVEVTDLQSGTLSSLEMKFRVRR